MKKTYNFLIKYFAICLLFFMAACNKFLDVTPPSQISPESYLRTEGHLASYILNYYANYSEYNPHSVDKGGMLPSPMGGTTGVIGSLDNHPYKDDLATDNLLSREINNINLADRFSPGVWRVGSTGGFWNFTNINALNYFLYTVVPRQEAGQITGNATNIQHYVGEGYFLRAHEYFFRLKRLGDFPIITEPLPDNREMLIEASKRRPRNEVARFILSDLDKAIALLTNNPDGGKVHITKNAALLLKARVALFEATWEKYHAGTAHVPSGPGWPGTAQYPGYQFPAGSLQGEIDFFLTEAMNASSQVADAIPLVENNKVIRQAASNPVNPYYDMFASANPGVYSEVIMYRAYNTSQNIMHSYNHRNSDGGGMGFTRQFADAFLMENGLPIYAPGSGYAGDDYVQNTKTGRDWRWKLFMKAPGEVMAFLNTATPGKFPAPPVVYSSDRRFSTATGYIHGKGYTYDFNMQVVSQDITASVIFRAAEAYLIYIEASYEKNGAIDSKADGYWKAIRRRAGVSENYQATIAATNMAVEALNDWGAYSKGVVINSTLYNIRRERRCEFIGEGMRSADLQRWRAMDQLNGFQLEGCKIWGPMKNDFPPGKLVADAANQNQNTVSSPSLSNYLRPFQIIKNNNNLYNGCFFNSAYYLEPIAAQHFLITAPDGQTASASSIYQNPGWPTTGGQGAN